jgi:dihydroorotase-like cyclic amidohydrolase
MDLILRQARVRGHDRPVDIGVHEGLITKIAPKIAGRDHDFVSLKELGLM